MIYLTHNEDVLDTKKIYLDAFFREHKADSENVFKGAISSTRKTLLEMHRTFLVSDKLLRSSGMTILYYLIFERARIQKWRNAPARSALLDFEARREENRAKAEKDITKANYDLLEFDRLTQTPNDAYAIKFRLGLLENFIRKGVVKAS
jgi:hypothetical protein